MWFDDKPASISVCQKCKFHIEDMLEQNLFNCTSYYATYYPLYRLKDEKYTAAILNVSVNCPYILEHTFANEGQIKCM